MQSLLRSCLVPLPIFVLGQPGLAKPTSLEVIPTALRIKVHVYNLAHALPATLGEAEKEASKIFGLAGVQLTWVDCSTDDAEVRIGQTCHPPFGSADLRLRLLPHRLAELRQTHPHSLGLALPCPATDGGCFVNVFYQRAEELATDGELGLPKVLGHAIAHEIGHLLLGSNAHSPVGIMRAKWGPEDLRRANRGNLLFGAKEAELIRAHVAVRMVQQGAQSTGSSQ